MAVIVITVTCHRYHFYDVYWESALLPVMASVLAAENWLVCFGIACHGVVLFVIIVYDS